MPQVNRDLVELIVGKVCENEALLDRFLAEPGAVIAELTRVDQATLDAIGERLRERLGTQAPGELTDSDLEKATGGLAFRIATFRPILGRGFSFSSTITMT